MTIELADIHSLKALAEAIPVTRGAQPGRVKGRTVIRPVARRQRCTCGECATCIDNAKWERIFNEKFADPYYYQQTSRRGSSLAWV